MARVEEDSEGVEEEEDSEEDSGEVDSKEVDLGEEDSEEEDLGEANADLADLEVVMASAAETAETAETAAAAETAVGVFASRHLSTSRHLVPSIDASCTIHGSIPNRPYTSLCTNYPTLAQCRVLSYCSRSPRTFPLGSSGPKEAVGRAERVETVAETVEVVMAAEAVAEKAEAEAVAETAEAAAEMAEAAVVAGVFASRHLSTSRHLVPSIDASCTIHRSIPNLCYTSLCSDSIPLPQRRFLSYCSRSPRIFPLGSSEPQEKAETAEAVVAVERVVKVAGIFLTKLLATSQHRVVGDSGDIGHRRIYAYLSTRLDTRILSGTKFS